MVLRLGEVEIYGQTSTAVEGSWSSHGPAKHRVTFVYVAKTDAVVIRP
jgi:hypothetical protein